MVRPVAPVLPAPLPQPAAANPFNPLDAGNWRDHFLRISIISAGYLLAGSAGLLGLRHLYKLRRAASLPKLPPTWDNAPSPSTWKIDTTGFHDPELGCHLTQLFFNPRSVRVERSLDAPLQAQIKETTERLVAKERNHLNKAAVRLARQAVQDRLKAFCRLMARPEPFLREFSEALKSVVIRNTRTALWGPMEHVLNQLHGSIHHYACWGVAGKEAMTGPFMARLSYEGGLQRIRRLIGDGFAIDTLPGEMESQGGFLHQLSWVGFKYPLRDEGITLMKVGFVRRPDGFAIVSAQGGRIGRRRVTLADGSDTALSWHAQRRFGDLHLWLSRQVLRKLSFEDPAANLYWLKGEANFWLYPPYSTSPLEPAVQLSDLAGNLGPRTMRGLLALRLREVRRARETIQALKKTRQLTYPVMVARGDVRSELKDVLEYSGQRRRMNQRYRLLGFDPGDEQNCWALLRPGDPGWRALQVRQPTDLA